MSSLDGGWLIAGFRWVPRGSWMVNVEPAPGAWAVGGEGSVLGFDEGTGDGESDAASGLGCAGGVGSVKPLEEVFSVGGIEPRARVGDAEFYGGGARSGGEGDHVSGVAVVQGVGKELVEDLDQAVVVGEDVAPAGPCGVSKVTPARVYRAAAEAVALRVTSLTSTAARVTRNERSSARERRLRGRL